MCYFIKHFIMTSKTPITWAFINEVQRNCQLVLDGQQICCSTIYWNSCLATMSCARCSLLGLLKTGGPAVSTKWYVLWVIFLLNGWGGIRFGNLTMWIIKNTFDWCKDALDILSSLVKFVRGSMRQWFLKSISNPKWAKKSDSIIGY